MGINDASPNRTQYRPNRVTRASFGCLYRIFKLMDNPDVQIPNVVCHALTIILISESRYPCTHLSPSLRQRHHRHFMQFLRRSATPTATEGSFMDKYAQLICYMRVEQLKINYTENNVPFNMAIH